MWLQTAQIENEIRRTFYHIPNIGRKSQKLFDVMLDEILKKLEPVIATATFIRLVLDDSPTKRKSKRITVGVMSSADNTDGLFARK
ncbi:MAG: hypothetical protein LBI18_15260 [Planctomycetaceae bacterium]|nr:hypothetical protein [Planctomycetaceae bacterium]